MSKYSDDVKRKTRAKTNSDFVRQDWRKKYVNNDLNPTETERARMESSLARAQRDLMKIPIMRDQLEETKSIKEKNNSRCVQFVRMANRRMLMACFEPLAENFSPLSLVTTLSMISAAYLLNDRLRDSMKMGFNKIQEKRYANAIAELKENPGKFGNKYKMDKLYRKWEKYASATRNGRIPLNAESAASFKINLEKERYDCERNYLKSGLSGDELLAKLNEVQDRYDDNMESLREMAMYDNVDWADVEREERIIVERLMRFDKDGDYAYLFDGLAQGNVVKSAPQRRMFRFERDGVMVEEPMDVWDGQFHDTCTNKPYVGGFEARPMYNKETLADDMADLYTVSCVDAQEFDEKGDTKSLADSQIMMYRALNDFIKMTEKGGDVRTIPVPDELLSDPELIAMRNHYMNYFAMAQEDGMSSDDVCAAVGLATSQGLSSWITAECIGEDYDTNHDDIGDVMQAMEFAMASNHLDPNSNQWQAMADSYFSHVYKTDRFEAENPDNIRSAWEAEFASMENAMRQMEQDISEKEIKFDSDSVVAQELSAVCDQLRLQPTDDLSDSELTSLESDIKASEKKRDDMNSSLDKLKYDILQQKRNLEQLREKYEKAKERSEKHIVEAERVWADKSGYEAAVSGNMRRKKAVTDMSKVFTESLRTAEIFGASEREAESSLKRGVGSSIQSWADGDENNIEFANVMNFRAKRDVVQYCNSMKDEHPDWFVRQNVESASEHFYDVVKTVYNRYGYNDFDNNSKSYGQRAAEKFGFDEDDDFDEFVYY